MTVSIVLLRGAWTFIRLSHSSLSYVAVLDMTPVFGKTGINQMKSPISSHLGKDMQK